ncbi:MAG: response regulator [Proteobacteria bacterium]|nr:response regulator [Pseudomonadota bacterium]
MTALPWLLIVEDDHAHAAAMTRALELDGRYRTRHVTSLAAARHEIAASPPALVLADLNLGDGRAFELLPGPLAEAPFPILVLTSHGDEHAAVLAMRSGALDYLVKSPDTFASLPQTVERALREWRHILERRAAEQALRESEARFRVLFEAAPDAIVIHDADGRVLDCNRAAELLVGRPRGELVGGALLPAPGLSAADRDRCVAHLGDLRAGRPIGPDVITFTRADERVLDIELRAVPLQLQGTSVALAIARDVTARRLAQEAHRRLEDQLRQATKMEAIGRLAGGVAHDFNNILTVILSYTEVLLLDAPATSVRHADLTQIQEAAKRAASLTMQLLAFSRKQVIEPVVIDLHELLATSTRMLCRMIGEDVHLGVDSGRSSGTILADRSQLEQVLINLAVNARDAMPAGGKLVFSTRDIVVDAEASSGADGELVAGTYVQLSVTDDGVGMSAEVLEHIFEPFYTTKPLGQGTGLGLSMIYGIVRQSGGFLRVRSTVGAGTTFDLYFPRHDQAPVVHTARTSVRSRLPGGHERVLIVEDEPAIRNLAGRLLRSHGYEVALACTGEEAVALVDSGLVPHLLVTDVILPTLNGREVYDQLAARDRNLRVLYTSGYPADVIARHGVLDASTHFLQKPFTSELLMQKVRDVLDS